MIEDGRWDDLLTKVPVKKGDFFYVPSGTIHAIGKGIMILETQQSSDTLIGFMTMIGQTIKARPENCISNNLLMWRLCPLKHQNCRFVEIKQGSSAIVTYLETEFSMFYEWGSSWQIESGTTSRLYSDDRDWRIWSTCDRWSFLWIEDGNKLYSA